MNAVRSYTQRAFIYGYHKGTFSTDSLPYTDKLKEQFIEIKNSEYNDGFYWIDESGKIEGLIDETFEGYVIWIKLPIDLITLKDIDAMLRVSGNAKGVRRQQLGDFSYTLSQNTSKDEVGGIPITMLSSLNMYRQLPCGIQKEYEDVGII